MSKLTLIKDDTGRLRGIDPAHERAYQKWRKQVTELQVGDTLGFSYRMPRTPREHRRFFHKMRTLLERTEEFTSVDKLRYWAVMGAGYFDLIPGIDGVPNAIPQSIDFDSLDEQLQRDWAASKGLSRLDWQRARQAALRAWERGEPRGM